MRDDHRLRARSQLRDDDKLRDDHKLRLRSQIACLEFLGILVPISSGSRDFVLKNVLPYKLLTVNCSNFFMLEFKISTFKF